MTPQFAARSRARPPLTRLFAGAGLAAIIVPTLVTIARAHWSQDEGAQGPIILATGAWLLWRARATLAREAAPLSGLAWPLAFVPLALLYAFARAYGILFVETASAYVAFLLAALIYLGPPLVRRFWFPFLYPAFLIVPPATVVAQLTLPLKLWISSASVELLYAAGYPVALAGVTIQIGPYELLVRQACSGLGSMLSLCAIGLFYAHLRRSAGARHGAALLMAILPMAIFANFVRVILLVLLTWYFGVGVAQGMAHDLAGLLLFFIAVLCMLGTESAIGALDRKRAAS